jgi:hypothetical protein
MMHVIRLWVEWELTNDGPEKVLVAETGLETNPEAEGFSESDFDDLASSLVDYFEKRRPMLDRIRIIHRGRQMPRGPKGEKRPADVVGAAVMVAKIATGELPNDSDAAREPQRRWQGRGKETSGKPDTRTAGANRSACG